MRIGYTGVAGIMNTYFANVFIGLWGPGSGTLPAPRNDKLISCFRSN